MEEDVQENVVEVKESVESSLLISELSRSQSDRQVAGTGKRKRLQSALISERLKELQYEVSRLNRKVREFEEEDEHWSLRYTRRGVIFSNVMLGCWIFILRFLRQFRKREKMTGLLAQMFIPPTEEGSAPLSVVLISSILQGGQSALPFCISAVLHLRPVSWRRNSGFALSTGYSALLAATTYKQPRMPLTVNAVLNLCYLFARYYYLHGLLSFNDMRIL